MLNPQEPGVEQSASGSVRTRQPNGRAKEYFREYMRKYRQNPEYREREREYARSRTKDPAVLRRVKKYNFLNKVHAILMVAGEIACRRCRIDDIRLLTLNHINGGGCEERRKCSTAIYFQIRTGRRGTEGLEVTCWNCNILHEYDRGTRGWPEDWQQILADTKAEVGL